MPLTADAQLLDVWESGLVQHPVDRALTLLLAAEPGETRPGLAALPLSQLDGRLLRAYRQAIGPRLACRATCPACGEELEFGLETAGLESQGADRLPPTFTFARDGYTVEFRLPNSLDLAASAACTEEAEARRTLLARCILRARQDAAEVDPGDLPDGLVLALEERIGEFDPQAEWLLDLVCAACGHAWQERLDIAGFIWAQVHARARRVLLEVHSLASAYGWSEGEILAMSPARRQAYREMIE